LELPGVYLEDLMDPEKQFAMFSGLDLICCVMFNKDVAENEYGWS
jgi:hypothetical protein